MYIKKLIPILTLFVGFVLAPQIQAQSSLSDMIAEAQAEWLIQSWEGDVDGSKVSLSFKWVIEGHVIASHFKGNNSESYSLIAVNPESGEVEQTGYNKDGKKNTGSWGPKDEMPFLKLTSKDGEGNSQTMGVGFRLIDKNNIEKAPVINHTDLELIMLEEQVLRKPTFVGKDGKVKAGYY